MVTFSDAITNKYFKDYDLNLQNSFVHLFLPKFSQLKVPQIVVLADLNIRGTGNLPKIKKYCKEIKQLDLSRNELSNWREILNISRHIPQLEFLNISENKLRGQFPKPHGQLNGLKCLVLNGTHLDWQNVARLLEMLPFLEELHLSCNGYKKVFIDVSENEYISSEWKLNHDDYLVHKMKAPHKGLKTLYFRNNRIRTWKDVCRLGNVFPYLETLVLSECPLTLIGSGKVFPHLKILNLNDLSVDTWDSLDQLSKFSNIRSLCVRRWPLWTNCGLKNDQLWRFLINRLPAVEQLNGSLISIKDREEAYNTCQYEIMTNAIR